MAENEIGSLDQSEETLDNLNLDEVVNEEEGPGDGGPGDGYPPVRRGGQRLVYTGGPGDKIKIPRGSGDYTNIQANTLKKLKVDGYEGVSAALDHLSRQDPFFGTGHRRSNPTPVSKINKYDDQKYGYISDVDLDDFYGKQEAWYETLGKAVPKFAIKTVSKTFQGLGYLGGLLTPSNWGTPEGVVSKAADNALAKLAHNFEQKSDIEWFPSFQEAADREKGFWARATTDLDFWTDDVVDGLAFMASSWIPGMTLAKMGIGAKAMRGVGAMFKTGSRALGSTIEGAEKVSNYFKNSKKAARMLDAFSAWSLATASESMFEANDVRDKVIESLSYDSFGNPVINPDTNSPYTEDEKRKKAGEAARNTFLMNALVLGGTNVFEYRYISKMFGNAAPTVGRGIVAGELGKQATLGLAAPSALKTFGKTAALGIAREGFIEENMQLAIQRYNTKYGIAGKVGSMLDLSTYGDVLSQYAEQTKEAISGKDNEAAMNIGIGGILGSIIPGAVAIKEEKREYANSQKILAGLNEAQDQFVKVGNIYKTEEYEQKDGNGNPFMAKRIYLDNMGRPVVDQEKLAAIAAGIQINNEMLMESEQEVNKTKQKFLRAESFGDLVSSYIKAGIENNLLENLDKIAEYNSDDIAKLGFFPDETLKDQIAAYKQLASTIIKQNEILNSDIIFDNSKIDYARKNYLTDLAAKQAVRRYVANDLTSEVESIKSELINQDNSSLSDGLVDQLNEIIYRIESQKATIAAIKEGKLERVLPLEVYESVLSELESTYEKIKEDNKTSIEQLKKDPNSVFYDYEKSQRNEFGVRDRIESRLFRRAELLNEIRNTGVLWARYADLRKGKDNYSFDFEALVEKQQEIKRTAEQEETKKREEGEKKDEEQNGFRAVEANNNSFSVVSPDGSTVVDEIETKEKAEEVAKNLNNRQKPEQEVETSVEEKKKQLRSKIDALPDNISYAVNVTTADNAKLFFDTNFPYDLESSLASKVSFFSDKQTLYDFLSSLIEQDKSAFVLSFSHAEFGNVGINQIEEALVYEYEDLFLGKVPSKFTFGYFKDGVLTTKNEERPSSKSEISKTEEEKTLQEYLDEKHAALSTNPAFKIPYEEWINSPAINSHIKDYNKKYGKNEPLFGEKPPVQPAAPVSDVTKKADWIGNLSNIKDELNKLKNKEEKLKWLADNNYLDPFTQDGKTSLYLRTATGRVVVKIKIGKITIPFYISTGSGGKTDVETNKWYVFFGQGKYGWFNKTSGKDINEQYGVKVFQDIAGILNDVGSNKDEYKNHEDEKGFMDLKWTGAVEDQLQTVIDFITPVQPAIINGELKATPEDIAQLKQNIQTVKDRVAAELTALEGTKPKALIFTKYNREDFPDYQPNTRTPATQKLLDYFAEVMGVPKYTEDLSKGEYPTWIESVGKSEGAEMLASYIVGSLNNLKKAFDAIAEYEKERAALEEEEKALEAKSTAPVSDALVEEIDNLKLEETKLKDIPKVAKLIRDIFAKIINRVDSENLIDRVNKKISLIKDQVAKSYLVKMLSPDTSESEYIDQRTKGILVNNPEHKYQDKISIDKQMLNSGFKLNSDKKAEQLFGGGIPSNLNENIRVIASRAYVKKSKQILEEAGIPNRTIITLETDREIEEKLKKGQSVIALTNKMDGFHINIYSRTNDIDNVYVVGVDGYAIVNPDNSTEKVEFTEQQREFVKANMLVNGRPMTDREYNILRDYYVKMQNFQNKLAEIAPDEVDELDITDIFKETFTFSRAGIVASKGESIQNLIKNNPNKLFTVLIETEDGKLVTKNLPLLAFSRGNSWSYEFPLEKGESIVQLDSSTNEVIPVTNLNEYLKNVQNLDLFMTTAYGGKIAWITSDKSEQRGYKPYTLESMKGTEPVDLFKRFVKTFKELKESIEKGDKEKVYTFKNKQYSTRAALLKDFNRFYYGFFASKGFYVDLSYNPKTKKFLFEILPADRELSNSLTAVQKKAMHLYFKDEFTKLTDNSSEQEVTDTYNQWILDLLIDFDKLHKSLLESNDNLLKEFGEKMKDYHVMFNYEDATNKRSFYLKLQDKDLKKKNPPVSFLYYNATPSDGGKTLQLAFNETVYEKPAEKEPPAPTESSEETGGPTKLDDRGTGKKSRKIGRKINKENKDDEAYMLFNSEEDYERYTEESFKSEIKWLRQALTNSGIQLRDLGTIIDSLLSGKQVLGYYKDQAIYVNKVLSRKGVVYHEAFHALFRNILTADQRAFYIQKAKEAMGPISFEAIDAFRNERGYFNKTDNEIYDLIAEEYLADGFMKYKLEQTEPRYSWFRKFVRTIERIINFFIGNETEIESLYRDFDSGRYASNKIEAQNISDEGAFAIITGRPKLHLEIDEAGEESFTSDSTIPFNLDLQNELINKLAYLVANDAIGSFSEKFEKAVERLKADYDIESLVAQNPEMAEGIRKKYQDRYYEASFILGESVPYALSEELINQPDAVSLRTDFGDNQESLNIIKKSVLEKIKSLGLEKGLLDTDLSIPEEDDEDIEIKVKTGEFDTIHMNPLEGLSAEFRSFFSMIPYTYEDRALGVKVEKMADGKALFNATIKVAADTPVDKILPSLAKAIETLEEDNDPSTIQLVAFRDFLNREFGMDISDPDALPSKNIYLYKQFIDTFFVTELPSYQIVAETSRTSTDAKIYNATINQDINNKKEAISYYFESAYRKLTTPEQKVEFVNNFKKMQDYIKDSFLNSLDSVQMNKRSFVNKVADELKDLMDAVNIKIPKSLIRQSMLAIYTLENGNSFNRNSKENIRDMSVDQRLMKEKAYLEKEFFLSLSLIQNPENFSRIFAETKESTAKLGKDSTRVKQINTILKNSMKYIIKYDITNPIQVYQNAELKNVWRYSRYTPPILLTQLVREAGGIKPLIDLYPVLADFFLDNKLFDNSLENQLFLKNLYISANGGFRQEIDKKRADGVTFGHIDTRALLLSNIVTFMNRKTITEDIKDNKGVYKKTTITTFLRSRTQEEATTTNFFVTGKYDRYVTDQNKPNEKFIQILVDGIRQEYNRIKREWATRDDMSKVRYNLYNNILHPETGNKIEGDSYMVDGDVVNLRAYQFRMFEHFFDKQKTSLENKTVRTEIKNILRDLAKSNVSFEEALKNDVISTHLKDQLSKYMDDTFSVYQNKLIDTNLVRFGNNNKMLSSLIPNVIREDADTKGKPIGDYGYSDLQNLLYDHHLNVFANKFMVNQIFDGDIATGIKSAVEHYKRNKSGVISGNSGKKGFFRTATVENIQSLIDVNDLLKYSEDVDVNIADANSRNKVNIADGQSFHTINHRIRLLDTWGRVDPRVRYLLSKYKHTSLTDSEVQELSNKRITLNSYKTATGAILEYYKLSEHLISRVDVSHMVVPQGMTKEDVRSILNDIYSEIELLEDQILEDPYRENAQELQEKISDLYREVHNYWTPKRSKEKLHYLLNSMEISGVDQVFDLNASKKTTVVPVKLNPLTLTDLTPSKSFTSNLFKFLQVETSGIHNTITNPTQARQILSTYIDKLDSDTVYQNMSLADLAKEYSRKLGEITSSSSIILEKTFTNPDGSVNIASLYKMMQNGLKSQGASSNDLKFFEVKNGVPVHNPNLLRIKKLFVYYYFAMFSNNVFSSKVSGRADILVSSYGQEVLYDAITGKIITTLEQDENPELYQDRSRYRTRHLGVSVEEVNGKKVYTVEVIIPKPLAKNEALKELYLKKLNVFFSTRIPTEDKRSMIVSKVVDYMDNAYQNSIVVPQLIHILAGSDLDVDKLYSHTFDYYFDYNDIPHVYGDYSEYKSPSQGRFVEYINYMQNSSLLKDAIDAEVEKVSNNPVLNNDFYKLKEELGIIETDYTFDELKNQKEELIVARDVLEKKKKEKENESNMLFESHIRLNQRYGSEGRAAWLAALSEQRVAQEEYEEKILEIEALTEEIGKMENTIRLAATLNVLTSIGMPTTQNQLTRYVSSNPNPVIPLLQNQNLSQKIAILSNEEVFSKYYINERSSTDLFKEVADSIGASVSDIVNENSIYSIMGDVIANEINSSSKDSLGISASFNKFLSFAEKNKLELPSVLLRIREKGVNYEYSDFQNDDGIRRTGESIGMFADAAKDPIPSVLNLNPVTSGVSNVINGMTGNMKFGLLINKVPFIEEITKRFQNDDSAAQEPGIFSSGSVSTALKSYISENIDILYSNGRIAELYPVDDKGNIVSKGFRKMFVEMTDANPEFVNLKKPTTTDLGFNVYYEDGTLVNEDVANIYLASIYRKVTTLNSDITKLGKILNLIKKQKPDFSELDEILSNISYFLSGDSMFGDSIVEILSKSAEYRPLMLTASMMDQYANKIFLERSPLFKSINRILNSGFNNTFGKRNARQDISDQITKFMIIQKMKAEMNYEIKNLQDKKDPTSMKKYQILKESYRYFSADTWMDPDNFIKDIDYLYDLNPGNPFVEFIKVNTRKGINFIEASTRMKMDKDITENILNGYESLQKSDDLKTLIISRQLFYYILVKDGLGYSNNTFLNYINADLVQFKQVSDSITDFQNMLSIQQNFLSSKKDEYYAIKMSGLSDEKKKQQFKKLSEEIYANYLSLFDDFFKISKKGNIDWINGMVTKIFANAANQKYIRPTPRKDLSKNKNAKEYATEFIQKGVFSNLTKLPSDKYFNFLEDAGENFTIDFSKLDTWEEEKINAVVPSSFVLIPDEAETSVKEVYFPYLLAGRDKKLYKLAFLDGNDVSKEIALASLNPDSFVTLSGLKGEYVQIKLEGTENLLSYAFTKEDGVKIFEHSEPKKEVFDPYAFFMSPSTISDNMSQEDTNKKAGVNSNMTNINGPVDESGFEFYDEDDVDAFFLNFEREKEAPVAPTAAPVSGKIEFDKLPGKSVTPTMTYAGIGSRQTPPEILAQMTEVARELSATYTLNTGVTFGGKKEGADKAFDDGATKKNLFSPENQGSRSREQAIAKEIHPNPEALSQGGLRLMARNTNQVFGDNLDTPVDFVLFYAEEVPGSIRPKGGTGQAVEMARRKGIPTINMANPNWRQELDRVLSGSTQPTAAPVSQEVKGNITLNIIEDWVQSGQATTTVRNSSYHNSFYKGDGVYTTDKGNRVNITYRGLVKIQGDKIVGNNISYTKDEFAKAEGFGTWENFKKGAKYAGKTLMDGGSVHLYDIKPAQAPVSGQREFTPENLSKANMPANGIFVFGSNTEGRHGLGAAETAKKEFGAIQGQPEGLQGRSYAIITKDLSKGKRSIPLYDLEGTSIAEGVKSFIEYANAHPELKFYVTKIGSKLAGYSVEEIKGVFDSVNTLFTFLGIENYIPDNVILPKEYEVRDNIVAKQQVAAPIQQPMTEEEIEKAEQDAMKASLMAAMKDSAKPQVKTYPKIESYLNGLSKENRAKLGSLKDLIAEFEAVPFTYTEEDFIEDLKCRP